MSTARKAGSMTADLYEESLEKARRRIATSTIPKMSKFNESTLITLRRRYNRLLWSGRLTLVVWAMLIWVFK